MGFILSQQRLPCPAETPSSGLETCSTINSGYLPFITLGLPEKDAGHIRYGVMRRVTSTVDTDLTQRKPRLTITTFNPQTEDELVSPVNDHNGMARDAGVYLKDFCAGIHAAAHTPLDVKYLYIKEPSSPFGPLQNVAYALAVSKKPFDYPGTVITLNDPAFDSPERKMSGDYNYTVIAKTPESLSSQLSCAQLITATRSYSNILLAANIYARILPDYLNQLDISVDQADAAFLGAQASMVRSSGNILNSITSVQTASSAVAKNPIDAKAIKDLTLAQIGLATTIAGGVANLVSLLTTAGAAKQRTNDTYSQVRDSLIPRARALESAIKERMERHLKLGIYLPIQVH